MESDIVTLESQRTLYRELSIAFFSALAEADISRIASVQDRLLACGGVVRDRREFIERYKRFGLTIAVAKSSFDHERTHQEVAKKHGVKTEIVLFSFIAEDGGNLAIPSIRFNIKDLKRIQGSGKSLRLVLGEILDAPKTKGFDYPLEQKVADYLLGRINEKPDIESLVRYVDEPMQD